MKTAEQYWNDANKAYVHVDTDNPQPPRPFKDHMIEAMNSCREDAIKELAERVKKKGGVEYKSLSNDMGTDYFIDEASINFLAFSMIAEMKEGKGEKTKEVSDGMIECAAEIERPFIEGADFAHKAMIKMERRAWKDGAKWMREQLKG